MRPIRKTVRSILLSLLVPVLCVTTAWADILDDCDSASGPGSYQNLSRPGQDYIRWDDPPDGSYLCQQNNRRAASAVYRCSGAREVTVAIYSRHGSYASVVGGGLARGGDGLPLWYQSSTGEVYCDGRRMVYDAQSGEFVFLEEEGRPSGLVEYGLSVYCSGDGADYTRVSAQLLSARREGPGSYWYEVYRAELKEGTRYLRLVLTDQSSIEILGREERYQFEAVGGLSLASVEIIEDGEVEPSWEDDWESEPAWEPADGDGRVYSEGDWETGAFGADGLPSYQPGEEEGPESLPWGPNEDPEDGGPAFPDESEDPEEDEGEEGASSKKSSGAGSSSSGGPSSSKAALQQEKSRPLIGQNGAPQEKPKESAETGGPMSALRRETPLWRRVTEPDAMSMMIAALVLLALGIRILWDNGGSRNQHGKKGEAEEREERYARYMGADSDTRHDRVGRRSKNRRRIRYKPVRWDDEDNGWNE